MKFNKNNIVAGKYVKGDDMSEICEPLWECKNDEELDEFMTDDFITGFLCACAFFACPDDAGTNGFTLKEFIRNSKRGMDTKKALESLISS